MIKVLVTGATGFIGSALCSALRWCGCDLVQLSQSDGDISDASTLANISPVDHVFHLAGKTFVPHSWEKPYEFIQTNVFGTTNVIDYCRRNRARLTLISAYLYGQPENLPISEEVTPRPNNPYAFSKLMSERVCEFYATHYGLDITVLRPFNIFGPGQKECFLIPHILKQIITGEAVRIKDLTPRRDYLFIDDLVAALLKTLDGPSGYNIFNIGSGRSFSVKEMIAVMQEVAGTDLPVLTERDVRINEIQDVYADYSKASRLLQWAPTISFKQGIKKMLLRIGGENPIKLETA